jgi:hypothetical protein
MNIPGIHLITTCHFKIGLQINSNKEIQEWINKDTQMGEHLAIQNNVNQSDNQH